MVHFVEVAKKKEMNKEYDQYREKDPEVFNSVNETSHSLES